MIEVLEALLSRGELLQATSEAEQHLLEASLPFTAWPGISASWTFAC